MLVESLNPINDDVCTGGHFLLHRLFIDLTALNQVQGMSFLAGMLLLNLDECSSFVLLCNILQQPVLKTFVAMDLAGMNDYMAAHMVLMKDYLPHLAAHLASENITPDLYLTEWYVYVCSGAGLSCCSFSCTSPSHSFF